MSQGYSLRRLLGWLALACVFFAAWAAAIRALDGPPLVAAVVGFFLATPALLFAPGMYAALDPWAPAPRAMVRPEPASRLATENIATVVGGTLLGLMFMALFGLASLLFVSGWDGETAKSLIEIGLDWSLVMYVSAAAAFFGFCAVLEISLYFGTRNPKLLVAPLMIAGIGLGPMQGTAWSFFQDRPWTLGLLGLSGLLIGFACSRRMLRCIAGSGRQARRWSGRGLLIGGAIGLIVAWVLRGFEVTSSEAGWFFFNAMLAAVQGGALGAVAGALVEARNAPSLENASTCRTMQQR